MTNEEVPMYQKPDDLHRRPSYYLITVGLGCAMVIMFGLLIWGISILLGGGTVALISATVIAGALFFLTARFTRGL